MLARTSVMLHETRPAPVMVKGAGSWLWDQEGRRYLDFVQGWAVNCLGHSPAVVRRALIAQSRTLVNASPAFLNDRQLELCQALTATSGLGQVFLCSSGAEANEGAVKLARKWGRVHRNGASRVITTTGSFHGRTLAMMAASGKPGWDTLFPPAIEGFVKVPHGDLAAVAEAIDADTAAVMVEPIQGEGGVVVPPAGYLAGLRALTRERGVLLIFDEIQTGVGRTGTLFGWQHEDARPDAMTLGKGIGGGTPLAALVASDAASCFSPGEQGGTYSGQPLLAAVGVAVLNTVAQPAFLARVRDRGRRLEAGLRVLATRFGCPEVRGRGLLWALMLPQPCAEAIVKTAREDEGVLLNAPRPNLLRFMPALNVKREELTAMLDALGRVMERVLLAG
jgi:acetylornithine/N-succinyldiaminopimelate aminotransferase